MNISRALSKFHLTFLLIFISTQAIASIHLEKIKLPPGFSISIFNGQVEHAREMAWGKRGTLFIGTNGNKVYAIEKSGALHTIAKGLNSPNGVAFIDGDLFVAEISRVIKFENIEDHLDSPPAFKVVRDDLPTDGHHGWKFISFGPDGKLYIPVGAPCNICEPKDPYASILRMNKDGSGKETFARGIRNTVGFDWHPVTRELWFTDNGRDMLGDDLPADELNHAPRPDMNFGYPYCHAGEIVDPDVGKNKKCSDYTGPAQKLGPHVASLGMRFYTGKMFPPEFRNQIFIAEHGSWNRSDPIGYRVSVVNLNNKGAVESYKIFAEGWLQDAGPWGRPVDVTIAPTGALLVSDDYAGAIYQITYKK